MVLKSVLKKNILLWGDFSTPGNFGDPSRIPFYFPLAENAGKIPSILDSLDID